jgi:hypothetical protein
MPESSKNEREANTYTNPLHSVWQTDPKRPVYSALLEAEFQRYDWLLGGAFVDQMSKAGSEEEFRMTINEMHTVLAEVSEIMDWIHPQQEPTSLDTAMKIAAMLRSANAPDKIIKETLDRTGKRDKGRPVTKRPIAILALEKQLLEPERNWSNQQLTQQFCNCGKDTHDNNCAQSMRQTIIKLKKVLAKYAPHLPVNKSG